MTRSTPPAAELRSLLRPLEDDLDDSARVAAAFFQALAEIHRQLLIDATAIERGDPAAESVDEVILAYPGFLAIAVHRIAHRFYELRVPLLPRVLSEWAHERTGIDIHPGRPLAIPSSSTTARHRRRRDGGARQQREPLVTGEDFRTESPRPQTRLELTLFAEHRRLAYDDAGAVVDDDGMAKGRPGVDIDARPS